MDPKRLREQTRVEHEATEAAMPLMDAELTRESYVRVLLALCPFVEGWEAWAKVYAPHGLKGMVEERRRGALLRADLEALGTEAGFRSSTDASVDWFEVVGRCSGEDRNGGEYIAAFLGALYVVEGSRLGGRTIARHVEALLDFTPGRGNSYFFGAGEGTGALWREVRARIEEVPEEFEPLVTGAARRTFVAFGDTMRAGLVTSGLTSR